MGSVISLGVVADYDQITISGKRYTANQILDKTLTASNSIVKTYSRPKGGRLISEVKPGQIIGKVISYIRASSPQSDGRGWLMFENSYGDYFFAPDEAVSGKTLPEQGAKTVSQEIKEEKDKEQKENEPIVYYFKKIAVPVLIVGGIGFAAVKIAQAYIMRPQRTALSGVRRKRKRRSK